MELTFINPSVVKLLKEKEIKSIIDKAHEILNDKGSDKIIDISAKIIWVEKDIITVEYTGEDADKVKYSQTVDFHREKNMQYLYA